jgi:hypothetical protein
VHFPFAAPTDSGICGVEESDVLNALEDELIALLAHDAVYIGRVNANNELVSHFHTALLGPAEARLRSWVGQLKREVFVDITSDPAWTILDQF